MKPKLFVIILVILAVNSLTPSLRAQFVKPDLDSVVRVINDERRPDHFRGVFTIEGPVRLGGSFVISFRITPQQNFSFIKIVTVFPDELIVKDGQNQRFEVNQLDSATSHTIFLEAIPTSTGEFEILSYVEGLQGGRNKVSNVYSSIIHIDNTSGTLLKKKSIQFDQLNPQQKEDFIRLKPKKDTTQINYLKKNQYNNLPQTAFNVTGQWQYDDIDDGFTRKSVRYATVKVIESGLFGGTLGTGYTDSQGNYSISVNYTGTKSLFVRVVCEASAAKVTSGLLGGTYQGDTDPKDVNASNSSTWSFGTHYFAATDACWPVLDDAIDEYQWIDNRTSWKRSQIVFWWPVGDWPAHKYDLIQGERIELPARATMTNPWTRLSVLHEYAHAVMYSAYGNTMPSGSGPDPHNIFSESSGGFALKEGWAEFMECAIDNNSNNAEDVGENIESNDWYNYVNSGDFDGDIIEGSVASILWDIFDSRSGDDDGLSLGFNNSAGSIWYIFLNNHPSDINQFWTYWFQRYAYNQQMWSIFYTYGINKDISPPTNPTTVSSTSHSASTWSTNSIISMSWSGASDDLSGVSGYSWLFDQSSTTVADAIQDGTGTSTASSIRSDGTNHYFHIRTKDNASNWNSSTVHRGPYWIDATAPTNPTTFSSSSHTLNTWSTNRNISISWSGASDNLSGVYGYSWDWSVAPDLIPDGTGTSTTSSSLGDGPSWSFNVKTRDNAGNWNSNYTSYGPFKIDGTAPINGTISVNNGAASTTSIVVTLNNLSASDGNGSGVSQMRFSNNSSTWSGWENYTSSKSNWDLSSFGGNSAAGQKWVYIQYRDIIGNQSSSFPDDINYTLNIQVTIQSTPSNLQVVVDGIAYTTTQIFSWTPGSSHPISTTSPQSGGTGIQYVWNSWSDNGAISHSVAPTVATTYTANFTTQYYLTVASNPTSGGITNPSGQSWRNNVESVSITATANSGYSFSGWSGDTSGTNNPVTVTMNTQKRVTANFNSLPSIVSKTPTTLDSVAINKPIIFRVTATDDDVLTYTWSVSGSVEKSGPDSTFARTFTYLSPSTSVKVMVSDPFGGKDSTTWTFKVVTGVEQDQNSIATEYSLMQNYPNPFNPVTTIEFSIPKYSHITLRIFNTLGIQIQTLSNQNLAPGKYRVQWDAINIPSGVYLLRMVAEPIDNTAQPYSEVRKLVMIK